MPKIPKSRLVISTTGAVTTEKIASSMQKGVILMKKNKKMGVMKFLANRAKRKIRTQRERDLQMHRPFKHWKPRNSYFRFKTIEKLIKNKHSQMKHWSRTRERVSNISLRKKLKKQLKNIPILIIVRLHRRKNLPRNLISIMYELRLLSPFDCILVRNSVSLQQSLIKILPYVTFGVPSEELIRDLILKRGKIVNNSCLESKKSGKRIPLESNLMIEEIFGEKYDLICIADVIHVLSCNPYPNAHMFSPFVEKNESEHEMEIETNDDGYQVLSDGRKILKTDIFDAVTYYLNPFALNSISIPTKGLTAPFDHKGYWGYRGSYINTFIEKIL